MLKIASESFSLRTAQGDEFKGSLRIEPSTVPKHVDFLLTDGTVWEGIYLVANVVLRRLACVGAILIPAILAACGRSDVSNPCLQQRTRAIRRDSSMPAILSTRRARAAT